MTDKRCLAPEQHQLHVCELKARELNEEVRRLFKETAHFTCANCAAKVNRAESVCTPKAL